MLFQGLTHHRCSDWLGLLLVHVLLPEHFNRILRLVYLMERVIRGGGQLMWSVKPTANHYYLGTPAQNLKQTKKE